MVMVRVKTSMQLQHMAVATHALVAQACLISNLGMPAQQVMMAMMVTMAMVMMRFSPTGWFNMTCNDQDILLRRFGHPT